MLQADQDVRIARLQSGEGPWQHPGRRDNNRRDNNRRDGRDTGHPGHGRPGTATISHDASRSGPARNGNGNDQRAQGGDTGYDPSDPVAQIEREALKLAVQRPGLCGPEFDALGPQAFTVGAHAAVFRLIAEAGGTHLAGNVREWAALLRESAPNDRARAFMTRLAVESPQLTGEPDARYVDQVLARVGELAVSREIAAVKGKLQRMNPVQQQTEYNQLFGDLVALEQRRKALLDRAAGL